MNQPNALTVRPAAPSPACTLLAEARMTSGDVITFQTTGRSPLGFHLFLMQARQTEQCWTPIEAVDDETGEPYVTGFDPRDLLSADVSVIGTDAVADLSLSDEQPAEQPAPRRASLDIFGIPGVSTRPMTRTETDALDRALPPAVGANPGTQVTAGTRPDLSPGVALLAALLGGFPPRRG